MDALLEFAGNYWWLAFVFGGSIGAGAKGIAAANERRAVRRHERYLARQQVKLESVKAKTAAGESVETRRAELARVRTEHEKTDERWLDYELDLATLLDYPMMTDLREPLTLAFHKAKRRADLARPVDPLTGEPAVDAGTVDLEIYRDAVHDYMTALDVAEAEARRRRRSDFTGPEQDRISRAQRLLAVAVDDGATRSERRAAYAHVTRELEGLIVVPAPAAAAIERGIAGELER